MGRGSDFYDALTDYFRTNLVSHKNAGQQLTDTVTIFIVEDDAMIRGWLRLTLEDAGYAVAEAASAEEAIAELEATDLTFRAVLTDINLAPGKLLGWDVAKRARQLIADIPIIYMSGDSSADWSANGVPNSVMLSKPFVEAQIVTAVSQLMNATPSSASANN